MHGHGGMHVNVDEATYARESRMGTVAVGAQVSTRWVWVYVRVGAHGVGGGQGSVPESASDSE